MVNSEKDGRYEARLIKKIASHTWSAYPVGGPHDGALDKEGLPVMIHVRVEDETCDSV